jgi:ubiquinone biosynthesis protein Coq4
MIYQTLKKWRQVIMERLTLWFYFPMLFSVYKPFHQPYSSEALLKMPKNSLGNSILSFLKKNNLKLIPKYELHDAKHVLTGYGTAFEEEIQLQFFEYGNGNRSLPVYIAIALGVLIAPDYLPEYIAAYRKGKNCTPITPELLIKSLKKNVLHLKKQLLLL